jgi:hypothetical protein
MKSVSERLRQGITDHPRLLLIAGEEAVWRRNAGTHAALRGTRDLVLRHAEALLPLPPTAYVKEGCRLLTESRRCLRRVLCLATAYRLTGDPRFARRAETEMLAVSAPSSRTRSSRAP